MKYCKPQKNRGASLLLVLLILTVILAVAFGVAGLMLGEIKLSQEVPRSLKAYYVAEAGIERSLYDARKGSGASDIGSPPSCSPGPPWDRCLNDDTCYSVDIIAPGVDDCPVTVSLCIKSYGCYKGTRRAIEVSY